MLCMEPIAACLALGDRLSWKMNDHYLVRHRRLLHPWTGCRKRTPRMMDMVYIGSDNITCLFISLEARGGRTDSVHLLVETLIHRMHTHHNQFVLRGTSPMSGPIAVSRQCPHGRGETLMSLRVHPMLAAWRWLPSAERFALDFILRSMVPAATDSSRPWAPHIVFVGMPRRVPQVIDCGGGTVDISSFRVVNVSPPKLDQAGKAIGGPWGSTNVDKQFEGYLKVRCVAAGVAWHVPSSLVGMRRSWLPHAGVD